METFFQGYGIVSIVIFAVIIVFSFALSGYVALYVRSMMKAAFKCGVVFGYVGARAGQELPNGYMSDGPPRNEP